MKSDLKNQEKFSNQSLEALEKKIMNILNFHKKDEERDD
jgi:hypothetical protein